MRSRPTVLITCLAALVVGTGVVGCSTSNQTGTNSVEYNDGWSAADSQFARMPENYTLGQKVGRCKGALTSVRAVAEYPLTQIPEGYSDDQRKMFARGCLDYLRGSHDVPEQPWER